EVAEYDATLGRLAEQAHVGDAAVGDQVAGSGGIATVLSTVSLAVLRLFDLAGDGGNQHVAAQLDAGVLQRVHGLDVAGERPLHVRDAEPVQPPILDERLRLKARDSAQPRLAS